eukprot:TRINITY_DN10187_c0_g1_i1.p1 TRINITY_DN10187_c0_g1~~TRINITY_DN10187_c0_g1_i1.p1  ORF type:complete len:397 (-),score=174.14 TRINITY_DN10187_c0_g1_i1:96-1139(-)
MRKENALRDDHFGSMKPIGMMSLNCYLVPALFSKKKVNSTCRNQKERSILISDFALERKKEVSLLIFQEMWGTDVNQVHSKLGGIFDLDPMLGSFGGTSLNPFNLFGYKSSLIDPLIFWFKKTGGLMIGSKKEDVNRLESARKTFTKSESGSFKGIQMNLLDVSSFWGRDSHLFLFNTHLDPNHAENKRDQIREIRSFVEEQVLRLEKERNLSLDKCGVLITGDFNIPSTWKEEHKKILDTLNAKDLYEEKEGKGLEGGETYSSINSYFTELEETTVSRRIDYFFSVDNLVVDNRKEILLERETKEEERREISFLKLRANSWEIVKQEHGKEMSDHWAQIVHILPQK